MQVTCVYSYIIMFFVLREPLGTVGRFTITPQRHYPLQQSGVSSVGVLPPVKWDGFRKKNVLSPRNSPAVLSPVTVKIARPDHHSTPRSLHSCKHFIIPVLNDFVRYLEETRRSTLFQIPERSCFYSCHCALKVNLNQLRLETDKLRLSSNTFIDRC